MKDSQHGRSRDRTRSKYIKENNERFSTERSQFLVNS